MSIVCGTGIVVPLDKSLPANELELLIERSDIEAIFYTKKYSDIIQNIKYSEKNKLKHLISMDSDENFEGIYSQKELIREGRKLIEEGNNEFLNAKIDPKEMEIMLFTSGTTSKAKVVALSHENICTNLMDIGSVLDVTQEDVFLSILPIHHVFECTVGFLFSLYKGAETVFCDGLRHIVENLNEYHVTVMACVPGIYERIFMMIRKKLEKQGKLEEILKNGKNIFLEEMENLVNKIEGIRESFIFGKIQSNDENNIKINVKIVFDRDVMKEVYKVEEDEDIYKVLSKKIKEVNQTMPSYKAIRGMILTEEPLIKTTTNKIKRQENLDEIRKLKD